MDLDGISVFVRVVQAGSFSKAARLLGMPNTTVSAKVARLEKRLGVTLIQRTTRRLHVTPAGQAYFAKCMRGLMEIEAAEAEVSSVTEPQGLLRITAPGDVAHILLPALVSRYLATYVHTSVELIVTNRTIDLVGEGVDLAIRAAVLKDSTLVARKFISFTGALWSSRAYLKKRGTPKAPADLAQHDCLLFSRISKHSVRLTNGRRTIDIPVQPRIVADDPETLRGLVLEGTGIGALPDFLGQDYSREGRLVRVLPQWTWATGALFFVYPSQPFVPANVRAFIDLALASQSTASSGAVELA